MEAEPYLLNERGQRVDRRWLAGLSSFGAILLVCPLGCLAGVGLAGEVPAVAICGLALAFLFLLAGAVIAWVIIFRVARRLNAAQDRFYQGDLRGAVREAQAGLLLAFRGDFRAKGFHVLGLCAERDADFASAAHLFERAREALPAMAAPMRRRRATVLAESHRALCLSAVGRQAEAAASIRAAEEGTAAKKGAADLLLDDGDWGLGTISINSVIMGLERRKDPEALLQLARALVARNGGDHRAALHLLTMDEARLSAGLAPHELELATRLADESRGRLDAAFRAPGRLGSGWAARVLEDANGPPPGRRAAHGEDRRS